MAGQGTPATALLAKQKVSAPAHPYEVARTRRTTARKSPRRSACPPEQVFKTLVAEVDGALTVAVVPVTGELDLKALAAAVGGKRAALADRTVAERATGYVRGGISPLGQRRRLPTVVDVSAQASQTVYVSAGRRGLQLELAPADLVASPTPPSRPSPIPEQPNFRLPPAAVSAPPRRPGRAMAHARPGARPADRTAGG